MLNFAKKKQTHHDKVPFVFFSAFCRYFFSPQLILSLIFLSECPHLINGSGSYGHHVNFFHWKHNTFQSLLLSHAVLKWILWCLYIFCCRAVKSSPRATNSRCVVIRTGVKRWCRNQWFSFVGSQTSIGIPYSSVICVLLLFPC